MIDCDVRLFLLALRRRSRSPSGRHAGDAAGHIGSVLDETARCGRGMRGRNRQIEIAHRPVNGIAQPLDHGVLQGTGELSLQNHFRQVGPFGRLLELLGCRLRLCRLLWHRGRLLLRASELRLGSGSECNDGSSRGNHQAGPASSVQRGDPLVFNQNSTAIPARPTCSLPPPLE